jgi:hypothetical protein
MLRSVVEAVKVQPLAGERRETVGAAALTGSMKVNSEKLETIKVKAKKIEIFLNILFSLNANYSF